MESGNFRTHNSSYAIKKHSSILKYGNFELVFVDEDIVAFRRTLKDESFLCIVNRDGSDKQVNIKSNAHSVDVEFGFCTSKLVNGEIQVQLNPKDIGVIISEK